MTPGRGLEMPASERLGGQGRAGTQARPARSPGPPRGPEDTFTHSAESTSSRPCDGTGGRSRSRRPRPAPGSARGARALEHGEALSPHYGREPGPREPGPREPALASVWLPGRKPRPGSYPGQPFTTFPPSPGSRKQAHLGGLNREKRANCF